ncbi:hypothetical protein [Clostridium tertium]|uniref:hypothetical protein n=1 Tax=Clostridium tertium TaxID=1559 RepID=UPI002A83E264|nr:hypothetical protein [Clostridium tertium]MDY4604032.1 hypothetical protein [Clostridium tertium]
MSSIYYNNLIKLVIDKSESERWEDALEEWDIFDCEEDNDIESSCICGKENIKYLFTIKNVINGNEIYPIGSSCIKKFNRTDLNELITIKEGMFKLLREVEKNAYISLSSELFTRRLLKVLYEEGAFKPNKFNRYDSKRDYEFMLKMFNKKNKDTITESEDKRIKAIIINCIKPHLKNQLENKRKNGESLYVKRKI